MLAGFGLGWLWTLDFTKLVLGWVGWFGFGVDWFLDWVGFGLAGLAFCWVSFNLGLVGFGLHWLGWLCLVAFGLVGFGLGWL